MKPPGKSRRARLFAGVGSLVAEINGGLLLDDYEWAKTAGSTVDIWAANSGSNQTWTLTQTAAVSGDADQVWTIRQLDID